jgi:UDPglucose--hexose-1-phosphate uridylyltransferase
VLAPGNADTVAGQPTAEGPEVGLASSVDPLRASSRGTQPDLFARMPAAGAHEVIVHSPEHATSLAELSRERFAGAVAAWRERMRAGADDASYVHLIVNEGPDAGASLEHSHAQLYAMRFVPAVIARERERASAYHERTMGGHLLAEIATEEVRRGERLVAVDDEALLICPWASRSPFELRVVPRRPAPSFELDGETGTGMIDTALRALAALFDSPPQLNLWVRTAPRGADEFCWYVDLAPRLTVRAGFELGAGVEVNIYPPERAAADLRGALGHDRQ